MRALWGATVVGVLAGVWAAIAGAATPVLQFPAGGASVKVIPPAGFANGDVPFRWSKVPGGRRG